MMKKTIVILLAIILSISLLAACSGSKSNDSGGNSGSSSGSAQSQSMPSGAAMRDEYYGYDNAEYDMEFGIADAETAPMAAPAPGDAGNNSASSLSGSGETNQTETSAGLAEKIIYTASADIEAVNFDETIEKVYDLISFNGAFIETSYIGGRNYAQSYYGYQTYRSANFTLRVPKDRFEAVTGSLDVLGNVTSLNTNAENITAQFLDTESRLSSYRIQEERLLAMLEQSETVTDMITIESRLAEVRYSIESLTSTLKNWQNQVDYSTLTLYIREVENFTETVPIQQTYWQQVGNGLQSTTKSVGRFFTDLFKWIIVNLPVLIILAIIAVAIVLIVRRSIRKKRQSEMNRYGSSNNYNYTNNYNNSNYNNPGNNPGNPGGNSGSPGANNTGGNPGGGPGSNS